MIFPAENLTSRKGISFKIRSAGPEDAPGMLAYMKTMLGETPFLLRTPEEFSYTPEEEAVKQPVVNKGPEVGRNDPCPCGSGKKYKNCCGKGK